jgi:AcrR family transcriptional regulator
VPRAKLRTPLLRDHVLRVAMATLGRDGVAGFTTRTVANAAGTSPAAIYELFGDKEGLVREMFFAGFGELQLYLDRAQRSEDPLADLVGLFAAFRAFSRDHQRLAELMYSRPVADFSPGPEELRAGAASRTTFVAAVSRCVEAGALDGDPADIAHVLLALAQGLAMQEAGGWLGTTQASVSRRWALAFTMALGQPVLPGTAAS